MLAERPGFGMKWKLEALGNSHGTVAAFKDLIAK